MITVLSTKLIDFIVEDAIVTGLASIIFALLITILSYIAINYVLDEDWQINLVCGVVFASIFFTSCSYLKLMIKTEPYFQYKVIITDDVTYKDFTSQYKIHSQDGEIYTVTKREK